MYDWRKMSPEERSKILDRRLARRHPWHKPPHEGGEINSYHISSACYEHKPWIGLTPNRIEEFEGELLDTINPWSIELFAWAVLPNHYHLLLRTENVLEVIAKLGQLHGRKSFEWNKEENTRGRKVWHGCVERRIRTERHFWATMNYVNHNPVRHGYVEKWQEWPYSSAKIYLEKMGIAEVERIWREYPLLDYGKGWDDPEI